MNKSEEQFYVEVKDAVKSFSRYAIDDIQGKGEGPAHSNIKEDYEKIRKLNLSEDDLESLKKIVEDAIIGAVHSIFVSIDGGTALSDEGKALDLIDRKTGKPLTEGALHENFMEVFD